MIAAFLVSVGLFSMGNALQYVKKLSDVQKADFCVLASNNANDVVISPPRIDPEPKKNE